MSQIATREHRGMNLTALGAGCAQIGNLYRAVSDEEAEATVRAAWDAGVRYFDTAPHYGLGLSERRLGRALAAYPRDEYVLSTKVGRLLVPSPDTAGERDLDHGFDVPADVRREYDLSRDGVLRSVEASLSRLGLDRIDILFMHDPDEHLEAAATTGAAALQELRDEGVIGGFGAGMNYAEPLRELIERTDLDIVMCAGRLTLLEQRGAAGMLEAAARKGVAVVAAAPFNSGLLSRDRVPDDVRYNYVEAPQAIVDTARAIERVCRDFGVRLPAAAVQFPLRYPSVVSVVAGMRGEGQAQSTSAAMTATIPPELWDALAEEGLIEKGIA